MVPNKCFCGGEQFDLIHIINGNYGQCCDDKKKWFDIAKRSSLDSYMQVKTRRKTFVGVITDDSEAFLKKIGIPFKNISE